MAKFFSQILQSAIKKRVFVLIVILIITSVSAWFLLTPPQTKPQLIQLEKKKNPLLEDDDRDGLQNWEEQIYGTDPHNPDTDGDGTPDAEEIKLGRNPLIKGPNDGSATPQAQPAKKQTEGPRPNLTQALFDELMQSGGVQALTQKGGAPAIAQFLTQRIDTLVSAGQIKQTSPTNFPTTAIKISPSTDANSVKAYLNQVATTLKTHTAALEIDDLDLFLGILQSGETGRLEKLIPYRQAAEKMAVKIRDLRVPKNLAWFHTKEILILEETAKQIKIMENAERDPIAVLAILQPRVDLKIEFIKLHRGELKLWLTANKIILSPKDPAHSLVN